MSIYSRCGGVVAAVLAVAVAAAAAETCALELKRIKWRFGWNEEVMYRNGGAQHFYADIENGRTSRSDDGEPEFFRLVRKEPAKYNAEYPLKRVARLGSAKFCFVVDETQPGAHRADRLYFDLNGNGDLTDDTPIERAPSEESAYFPRVDLKIPIDGQETDYSFFLLASSHGDEVRCVYASLAAGAYRTGEIALGGKKHRLVLVDHNSNGRFDDAMSIVDGGGADDRVNVRRCDKLWVDPQFPGDDWMRITSSHQHHVSKLVCIDGAFYDLKITPAGDTLTLTPSTRPTGEVRNNNDHFTAAVYNDEGVVLRIEGGKDRPARLPVGDWKLLEYEIDATAQATRELRATVYKGRSPGVSRAIAHAVVDSSLASALKTTLGAHGKASYRPIAVRAGQSTALPFGPPYQMALIAESGEAGVIQLYVEIVGSAGEIVDDLILRGELPKAPALTIATKDGQQVAGGSFEYG